MMNIIGEYTRECLYPVICFMEPLSGTMTAQVHPRRTKREYALFCQALAAKYPRAKKIRLV